MAYINNTVASTLLNGTDEDDSIYNSAEKVTIQAKGGDDYIRNYSGASSVSINGGDGNDNLYNNASNVQIDGGKGNDSIRHYYYSNTTLIGGSGNDTIDNVDAWNISINGGDGNDLIRNTGDESPSIVGGKGNDTIEGTGREIIFFGTGDGKDVITNYRGSNKIILTSGKINSTLLSGNDIILGLNAKDSLTLKNAKDRFIRVKNVDGSETLVNKEREGKYIYTTSNQSDTILSGGIGEDTINNNNRENSNVTIDAGDGDDSIENRGSNSSINAGTGDDSIYNCGDNATIDGGTGDDSIRNSWSSYYYSEESGTLKGLTVATATIIFTIPTARM